MRNKNTTMYHLFQYDFSFCIFLYQALVMLFGFIGVALFYIISLLNFNYVVPKLSPILTG
jgi:hypothetical protein